ncbi:MAG: N-6 DNA methylase [Pseudomonadota bacterium]
MVTDRQLSRIYREAHNIMRNVDGLQPQEAFDELLKYLFFKQCLEFSSYDDAKPLSIEQVRELFKEFLTGTNSWSTEIWRDQVFHLTDLGLSEIHDLLYPIHFSSINYDLRSNAIREFLTPELRKGLGIYLTPDEVVKFIVDYVSDDQPKKVLDPACGSGTFLIEHLKNNKLDEVYGVDKSGKMLLLADLNLGHYPSIKFNKMLGDSLKQKVFDEKFDLILTNPPFGVMLDSRDDFITQYETLKDKNGFFLKKQTSEIVFIERCLDLLRPGGTLSIVIPKSIATNSSLSIARAALSTKGYIHTIVSLPPETFSSTGTQTSTLVLFIRKYESAQEAEQPNKILYANVSNVGFDSTGRSKEGNQLPDLANGLKNTFISGSNSKSIKIITHERKAQSFSELDSIFRTQLDKAGKPLLSYCEFIGTGKTPARKSYSESGAFLIKVGNLTGSGINWEARDRNYVTLEEIYKRSNAKKPSTLKFGDILLTSSAHSPIYIGKKSDVFTTPPSFLEHDEVSFVGEVMLIRPKSELIDPFLLLAYLRSKEAISEMQSMVRGQTAHLHSSDMAEMIIPDEIFDSNSKYQEASEIIKKQTELGNQMRDLVHREKMILT